MSTSKLKIPAATALKLLDTELQELRRIRTQEPHQGPLQQWIARMRSYIGRIFGQASSEWFNFETTRYEPNRPFRNGTGSHESPVLIYINDVEPLMLAMIDDIEKFEGEEKSDHPPQSHDVPKVPVAMRSQSFIRVKKSEALRLLQKQIGLAENVEFLRVDGRLKEWMETTLAYTAQIFGEGSRQVITFQGNKFKTRATNSSGRQTVLKDPQDYYLKGARATLRAIVDEVERFAVETAAFPLADEVAPPQAEDLLTRFYDRFHDVVRIMTSRQRRRPFEVNDEYDVQDLLHAMLVTAFQGVTPEDPSAREAGSYSKIDFKLPTERIGIELKIVVPSTALPKLEKDLKKDVFDHSNNLDLDVLHIFIYDPKSRIRDRSHFEESFNRHEGRLKVRCFIRH